MALDEPMLEAPIAALPTLDNTLHAVATYCDACPSIATARIAHLRKSTEAPVRGQAVLNSDASNPRCSCWKWRRLVCCDEVFLIDEVGRRVDEVKH
jgi:hypothetical protein